MVAVMLTYKMVSPFYIDPYDINGKFRLYFNCPIIYFEKHVRGLFNIVGAE